MSPQRTQYTPGPFRTDSLFNSSVKDESILLNRYGESVGEIPLVFFCLLQYVFSLTNLISPNDKFDMRWRHLCLFHGSDGAQTCGWLTGVEQEEKLQTGDLSAVDLQRPQPGCQLLTPLHQAGQSGLGLGQDGRQLHLQTGALVILGDLLEVCDVVWFNSIEGKRSWSQHQRNCQEWRVYSDDERHLKTASSHLKGFVSLHLNSY